MLSGIGLQQKGRLLQRGFSREYLGVGRAKDASVLWIWGSLSMGATATRSSCAAMAFRNVPFRSEVLAWDADSLADYFKKVSLTLL